MKYLLVALVVLLTITAMPVMAQPGEPAGGAPDLPDVVPDFVQNLLNTIWEAFSSIRDGIGSIVSGVVGNSL